MTTTEKIEILTRQRNRLLVALENLTIVSLENITKGTTRVEAIDSACSALKQTREEMKGELQQNLKNWKSPTILTGYPSYQFLWHLLEEDENWDVPNYHYKGYHWEGRICVAWDNSKGNCDVEEFKTETQAIAWLLDEEI